MFSAPYRSLFVRKPLQLDRSASVGLSFFLYREFPCRPIRASSSFSVRFCFREFPSEAFIFRRGAGEVKITGMNFVFTQLRSTKGPPDVFETKGFRTSKRKSLHTLPIYFFSHEFLIWTHARTVLNPAASGFVLLYGMYISCMIPCKPAVRAN